MLSMPILVIWVFGTQILIFLYLVKSRKKLNSVSVKKYLHIIYIGYKDEVFYWEFINTFKKFMLICFNVFFSQLSKSYKGMAAIVTLVILTRLQMFLKPYRLKVNNEVENFSNVAVGFTLYGGLLFIKGHEEVSFIEALTFILIITINSVYILFWIYLMAKTYDKHEAAKRIISLLKIVLFRGDNDTVLSGSNDSTSNHINEHKEKAPITKKHIKGVKNKINDSLKSNPLNDESTTSRFKMNRRSSRQRESIRGHMKLKKEKENNAVKHNEFWVKINKEFNLPKSESPDIFDFVKKRNKRELLVIEEDNECDENEEIDESSKYSQDHIISKIMSMNKFEHEFDL